MFKQPASVPGSFMPEDYLRRKVENRANAINLGLFGVVMFCVIGAFFVTHRQWNTVRAEQTVINTQYAAEAEKIEQLKVLEGQKVEMLEKAEITTALIEKVPRSILMAELINRMPEKLTLTELTIKSRRIREEPPKAAPGAAANAPKTLSAKPNPAAPGAKPGDVAAAKPRPPRMEFAIVITGFSATDGDVADYQASLKECPLLDRVDLLSSTADKVQDSPMRKFRIEAQIKVSADARAIAPLSVPRLKTPTSVITGMQPGAPARSAPKANGPPTAEVNASPLGP